MAEQEDKDKYIISYSILRPPSAFYEWPSDEDSRARG